MNPKETIGIKVIFLWIHAACKSLANAMNTLLHRKKAGIAEKDKEDDLLTKG